MKFPGGRQPRGNKWASLFSACELYHPATPRQPELARPITARRELVDSSPMHRVSATETIERGVAAYQAGRLEEVLRPYRQALESAPRPIATFSAVQARGPVAVKTGYGRRYRAHTGSLIESLRDTGVDLVTGALD